ncbi:sigma-54 interaction domain-containing protein [Rhizorhapis sp. SPR117]|uniref:sigma-54 interaction domain-containing protein n=1 Tax=Rhizorhapis sp. SPR117 TaxID=2912611 RepID=UPI001F268A95|nr:sigma-54 dependent transcriptional regulator [Rhizorhapis sp. SPR117]
MAGAIKTDAQDEAWLEGVVIGDSGAISRVRDLIWQVARTDASVMITGPSGSGKEIVATAIHLASARARNHFIAVNCGAIPRDLLESQLFGHEKGSFTGAIAQRRGRFEDAHGGSLFLDEIGDMPPDMQVKLLRVLESRQIERVGGSSPIHIDTRVISATHQNLEERIDKGQFREDLYYRLAVFPIHLPPLRDRPEDVPALIQFFLAKMATPETILSFTPGAMARLITHEWLGNVRELRNVVERAIILFPNMQIGADQVEALFRRRHSNAPTTELIQQSLPAMPSADFSAAIGADGIDLKQHLAEIERRYIAAALTQADGVIADAARLLSMQRTTFIEKMKRLDVQKGDGLSEA